MQNAPSTVLKSIKNILRTIVCRNRLSSLGILAMDTELAKKIILDGVINDFARKKLEKGQYN